MNHIPRIPPRHRGHRDTASTHGGGPAGRTDEPPDRRPPVRPAPARPHEPAIMLPGSVVAMLFVLFAVQLGRGALSFGQDFQLLTWFAFIPARYAGELVGFPGGLAADAWTFVTYALLHGSWAHLLTNALWLVAFGAAVARRFGAWRFWLFCAVTAAGGAAFHLLFHFGEAVPVVGASAAVAGLMAAAARFVFDAGGPLLIRRANDDSLYRRPARSLRATLTNRTAVIFISIFFVINLGIGVVGTAAGGIAIAWQAHLGGFLVGLFAFRLFDPVPR